MTMREKPSVGITKRNTLFGGQPAWMIDVSFYSMTVGQARQLAAEVLDLCDMAEEKNAKLRTEPQDRS